MSPYLNDLVVDNNAVRESPEQRWVVRWNHHVGQITYPVHRPVALLKVHGQSDWMILLQVLVVEDRVTGKTRQARAGLYRKRLTTHGVSPDIERPNSGQDFRGFIIHQN